ncbi:MAG: 23S rRNA (pseudouridine(1915)-N(3))-methyltransferase RlmH [Rhodospirillaceae bacterium]|nr:23S rRNA (pseudouridine(1915)-N(3))-methyltransferase RlmH [Rhodospirillaceae bacterium]
MRILIVAIGKSKGGPEKELLELYAERLPWTLDVKELNSSKDQSADVRKAREAEAMLAAVPEGSTIIALDERGTVEGSEKFAARVGKWRDSGARTLAFLIGGADGHGDAVLKRATHRLSLGAMTWPHMLVRGLLAEQLYRAHSILTNHPYHRA